jgi:hypothetical protein
MRTERTGRRSFGGAAWPKTRPPARHPRCWILADTEDGYAVGLPHPTGKADQERQALPRHATPEYERQTQGILVRTAFAAAAGVALGDG